MFKKIIPTTSCVAPSSPVFYTEVEQKEDKGRVLKVTRVVPSSMVKVSELDPEAFKLDRLLKAGVPLQMVDSAILPVSDSSIDSALSNSNFIKENISDEE